MGRRTRDRRFDRTKKKGRDSESVGSGAAACLGTVSGSSENRRRLLSTDHGDTGLRTPKSKRNNASKALEQNLTQRNTSISELNKQIQKSFPKYYFPVKPEACPWVLPA